MLWATTRTSSSSARYLGSKSSAGSTPSSGEGCSTTRLSRSRAATNRLADAVDSGETSTPDRALAALDALEQALGRGDDLVQRRSATGSS